jgi:hypothetical protein
MSMEVQGKGYLHTYSKKMERKLLNPWLQLQRTMAEKLTCILPATYTPNWKDVWNKARSLKEAGFL